MLCQAHGRILTGCLHALTEGARRLLTWLDATNEVSIVHQLGVQPDGKGVQRLAIAVCFTTPLGAYLHRARHAHVISMYRPWTGLCRVDTDSPAVPCPVNSQ